MTRKRKVRRLSLIVDVEGVTVTERFADAFETMADEAGIPAGHRVELVVAPSSAMRELKREHFGVDVDTDVIAFPTDFPELGEGVPALAGELFVGADEVSRNAVDEGWSFSEEFVFVVAHGLMQLRGWDDGTDADRRAMYDEQERLLRLLRGKSFDLTSLVRRDDEPPRRKEGMAR